MQESPAHTHCRCHSADWWLGFVLSAVNSPKTGIEHTCCLLWSYLCPDCHMPHRTRKFDLNDNAINFLITDTCLYCIASDKCDLFSVVMLLCSVAAALLLCLPFQWPNTTFWGNSGVMLERDTRWMWTVPTVIDLALKINLYVQPLNRQQTVQVMAPRYLSSAIEIPGHLRLKEILMSYNLR